MQKLEKRLGSFYNEVAVMGASLGRYIFYFHHRHCQKCTAARTRNDRMHHWLLHVGASREEYDVAAHCAGAGVERFWSENRDAEAKLRSDQVT